MNERNLETYEARVVDNNDPEKGGKLLVMCEALTGTKESYPEWIRPSFSYSGGAEEKPFGVFFIPDVDALVEIEVSTEGSVMEVKWRAGVYTDKNPIPEELLEHYPFRKGIVTPGGHILILDDMEGEEAMSYLHPLGSGITVDKDGSLALMVKNFITGGTMALFISAVGDGITLIDDNGSFISFSIMGDITLVSSTGQDMVTISDGQIQLMTSGNVVVSGNLLARSPSITLGEGAVSHLMKYEEWFSWASAHQHLPSVVTIPAGTTIAPTCADGAPVVSGLITCTVTPTGIPTVAPNPALISSVGNTTL